MSTDELLKGVSAFSLFEQHQETLEDAIKKSQKENASSIPHLRMTEDGTYTIRILPLAPVVDADGNFTMPRTGYEYPTKEYLMKIDSGKLDSKGLPVYRYLSVPHIRYVFPDLKNDLLDLYIKKFVKKYDDGTPANKKMCDTVKGNSFSGGLKYDSKRYMYVYRMKDDVKELHILGISYSNYQALESVKIDAWNTRIKRNISKLCPISSINEAQTVDIVKTTTGKKVDYSVRLTPYADMLPLTEKDLKELLDAPRLPEVLYRYSRKHLEATVIFLKQFDEKFDTNIMDDQEMKDCIDQIKMKLSADDQSHFEFDDSSKEENESEISYQTLADKYDEMVSAGLNDHSDEGIELKAMIRQYIEDKKLDISVSRRTPIADLLDEIEAAEGDSTKVTTPKVEVDEFIDDEEDDAPAIIPTPPVESDEPEYSERNDDTNEPAVRPRRASAARIRR